MNELSERLRQAVGFLKENGYAKSDSDIARKIGVQKSTFSMAVNGTRVPTWDMLLNFCEAYPVSFRWIRDGKGSLVKEDREAALLKRIEELERELAQYRSGKLP